MRYATLVVTIADEQIPTDRIRHVQKGDEILATYEAVYDVRLLADGTAVNLCRFRGDTERMAALASEAPDVLTSTVTRGRDELVFLHYEPGASQTHLLELVSSHELTVDWPITYTAQGLHVTLIGEHEALHRMIRAIPDAFRVRLERTGEYHPERRSPDWQLTERQREIVRVAIAAGYYETPRRATQRDIAARLDLAHGTVAEHLQKAEATLMYTVFGDEPL